MKAWRNFNIISFASAVPDFLAGNRTLRRYAAFVGLLATVHVEGIIFTSDARYAWRGVDCPAPTGNCPHPCRIDPKFPDEANFLSSKQGGTQ